MTIIERKAIWNDQRGIYQADDRRWYSEDGDVWRDRITGELVDDPEFGDTRLTFVGGPRDGESVY
jgi:hypothetical protein